MEAEKKFAYQEYVQQRLQMLTPHLIKYAMGDFSDPVNIPAVEDEFTELLVSVNLMAEDFQEMLNDLAKTQEQVRERNQELKDQKHLLDSIANTSPALIYVLDMETQSIIYINPGVQTLLGYSPDAITVMGDELFRHLIHPEDLPGMIKFQEKVYHAADLDVLETRYRMKHKNGEWKTFQSTERPFLRDEEGNLKQKIGIALDITDEVSASNALKESEEQLRLAIEASTLGVFDFDLVHGIVKVSDEWLGMLDYAPGELAITFDSWVTMLHPDDLNATLKIYQQYVTGEIPRYQVEFRMQKKDGNYLWIESTGRILARDAESKPLRMLGTHRNIDLRKEREEALAKNMHQLEQTNQQMLSFNRMAVGRENKMIELKQQVNALSVQLGKTPPYNLNFLENQGVPK